jgi:hypothetical protein
MGERKFTLFLKSSILYLFRSVLSNTIIGSFPPCNFLSILNEKFRNSI